MFARKLLTGLVTGGVAASVIGLTATGASAATDPDDSLGTPAVADLVGVGSDTSQGVLRVAADAYNQTAASAGGKLFTYAATGGGSVVLGDGSSIGRPNGSGAGKALLYGQGNNNQVDFARSSSGQSENEINAGLKSYPFALDTLKTVVAPNSNAPANLSRADLLKIYEGTVTRWDQVGGTSSATIEPLLPQDGSGTRSFFIGQLTAEKGAAFNAATSPAKLFQENDDSAIRSNPNAIAPFSEGRAGLLGTMRVEGGFSAQRALYNVVRAGSVGTAPVLAAFGPQGFLCSSAATGLIEDSGFRQLATAARGGSCGEAVNSTSTFVLNERANTSTTLAATSPAASQARLVAAVTSTSAPQGTVTFSEGGTVVASGVQLVSGQATRTIPAAPGAHTYTATFVPAGGSLFRRSSASAGVTVSGAAVTPPAAAKFGSALSESFPAKAKVKTKTVKGKKKTIVKPVKGAITVALAGTSAKGSGTVLVKRGAKTVGTGSVVNGVATFALNGLKKGNNSLTATYGGSATVNASTLTFSVNAKAAKAKGKK